MNNIELDFLEENCCGCSACYSICPVNAITMSKNEKGFLIPKVNKELCVSCGKCRNVCNFKKFNPTQKQINPYICRSKDINEVKTSRSGAFFIELAKYVIENNGIVYGCVMEKNEALHIECNSFDDLNKMKGSKYVQSDLKNTFVQCKKSLSEGNMVLFSGTGCQIHGLLSFLNLANTNVSRLITVDIVCHGCPSPMIFKDYLSMLEEKYNSKIIKIDFRDKKHFGWKAHKESFYFENGKVISGDEWAKLFYSHRIMRDSCFKCKYTTPYRNSDFTIADCWGIEKTNLSFNDDKGLSLVIPQNDNAKNLFQKISKSLEFQEADLNDYLQPQLLHPIEKPKNLSLFWQEYAKNKKKVLIRELFPSKFIVLTRKVKRKIKSLLTI